MKIRSARSIASLRCRAAAIALCSGAGLFTLTALVGCSSSVDRRADAWGGEGSATTDQRATEARRAEHSPSQAGSWELVFQSPGTASRLAAGGAAEEGPEYSRRDASLNPRSSGPVTALSAWPEAPRPDLGRARSVRVRDSESTFIYYLPTSNRRGGSSGATSDRSGWWY